ncbi:hypothetical protein SAMN02746041_01999 [Desulfacinum hydrothermale DSM 13146]|uniref:Uncharacterized protein n=1 Tax=Desulfacinum hydrothermale DSM 13146 TaxID=1121390 RepID=A0A1W1XKE0_9BACT|nr:hypothetical protein [Desulfacinum hydrothermale]SMC24450.1 hypothetical protein SAMN02746041_01999 [Desulfacinum hydrothermale DSM 13146]
MKRFLCVLMAVGLVAAAGCAKKGPEEAAKSFLEKQIVSKHKGIEMDTSNLTYKVVEQDETSAVVEVTGTIEVEARIPLVRKGGSWVVGQKERAPEKTGPAHMKSSQAETPAQHQPAKTEHAPNQGAPKSQGGHHGEHS